MCVLGMLKSVYLCKHITAAFFSGYTFTCGWGEVGAVLTGSGLLSWLPVSTSSSPFPQRCCLCIRCSSGGDGAACKHVVGYRFISLVYTEHVKGYLLTGESRGLLQPSGGLPQTGAAPVRARSQNWQHPHLGPSSQTQCWGCGALQGGAVPSLDPTSAD